MNDPIDRLRKLFKTGEDLNALRQFAEKSEIDRLEQDWKGFVVRAIVPAFAKVKQEVFGDKFEELTERSAQPGFKVKDSPNVEFWFWIELRGRLPFAEARLKLGGQSSLRGVSTPLLSSKPDIDLADISEAEILFAIVYAFENYQKCRLELNLNE